MLTCKLRIFLLLVLASQSFGCKSSYITQMEWGHHISVDEEGRARGHIRQAGQVDFKYEEQLKDEAFQTQYVDSILKKLEEHVLKQKNEARLPAQILIFIHGGLNSYEDGLEHIAKFLKMQGETEEDEITLKFPNLSSYFLLSLNWEAGLQSALIDHFIHIRFGERSTPFALSTFPIVLLHDLGESIVKSPDAIYSEAKDLFKNQSADFTSALLTTTAVASGYGFPIAILHPTLTIAGVMPYATYASAGLYAPPNFADDPTRYLFGPIRMASAPFIEGFGTPAWDMLKRRPDLLLFNPATQKDGATQKLLKQLSSKIQNGRWQTAECKYNKSVPCPLVELTLLGHSMGALVSDRILTTLSEKLTFKHIIYLGAANSLADFKLSVIPYLRDHDKTQFWSFALSEQDERNEKYHKYFDFLTRGSLLVWIDLLLERTYGLPQRRFGREVNQEWVNIDHEDAWKRICRISFSGNPERKQEPRKHGDFTQAQTVELVLGMVKNGCPEPVKLTKNPLDTRSDDELRKEIQKTLERVPRFTPKSIAAISNNAPFSDKGDLDYGEFLSEQSYKEIGNYFTPININAATKDELALLLRGDRYLARQIFERTCKNPYNNIKDVNAEIQHLGAEAYRLIEDYGEFGEPRPTDSLDCVPQDWWPHVCHQFRYWWSNVHFLPFSKSTQKYLKTIEADDRYRSKVISEIEEEPGINSRPIEEIRIWNMFRKRNSWDAVLDVQGQRVAIAIHAWAELEDKYHLEDQGQSRAEQLTNNIIDLASESDIDAIILVTNEDVFSKPSMAKVKEAIQKALGEKFLSVYGLPKTIPEKIKSVLQQHTKKRVS